MKRATSFDKQIQSLALTTSTKAQVIEKINDSSIEQLKQLVPEIPDGLTTNAIVDNADKILNPQQGLPTFTDGITEAIIKVLGRPVFFIQDGKPALKGDDIKKIEELVKQAETSFHLSKTIKSIGRIETDNLPGYYYVGTGWLF